MVSFGESYVVFYLLPSEQQLKLKIFPPNNLDLGDVILDPAD